MFALQIDYFMQKFRSRLRLKKMLPFFVSSVIVGAALTYGVTAQWKPAVHGQWTTRFPPG